MNYLIDDICSMISDMNVFMEYKSIQRKNGSGIAVFLLGLFSFSLFFINTFSSSPGLTSVMLFYLFMISGTVFIKLTFFPFLDNISVNLLKKRDNHGVHTLFYYAFLPFIFIYPINFIFYSVQLKSLFILLMIAFFIYLTVRIFAFCYMSGMLEIFFFLAICSVLFLVVFSVPIFLFGVVLII
ncbi:MAG: hypothetical protein ACOCWO_05195 [Candidatus Muiribacteriaceae bacterium]